MNNKIMFIYNNFFIFESFVHINIRISFIFLFFLFFSFKLEEIKNTFITTNSVFYYY